MAHKNESISARGGDLSISVLVFVFTDCESCTRPISTNPGSIEAGNYGLTRGTCFVERRLEVVAVAGLLWISRCVFGAVGFVLCFYYRREEALVPRARFSKKSRSAP